VSVQATAAVAAASMERAAAGARVTPSGRPPRDAVKSNHRVVERCVRARGPDRPEPCRRRSSLRRRRPSRCRRRRTSVSRGSGEAAAPSRSGGAAVSNPLRHAGEEAEAATATHSVTGVVAAVRPSTSEAAAMAAADRNPAPAAAPTFGSEGAAGAESMIAQACWAEPPGQEASSFEPRKTKEGEEAVPMPRVTTSWQLGRRTRRGLIPCHS
jgi:hypothetical protein